MRWSRQETVPIAMQVEHKTICCVGKQQIAIANHLYLNWKNVSECYEYVCSSASYLWGLCVNLCLRCRLRAGQDVRMHAHI